MKRLTREEKKPKEQKLITHLDTLQISLELFEDSKTKTELLEQCKNMRRICKAYSEVMRLSDMICLRFNKIQKQVFEYIGYIRGELKIIKDHNLPNKLTTMQQQLLALPECDRTTAALKECTKMKKLIQSYAEVLRLANSLCDSENEKLEDIIFYIKPLNSELYKIYIA